MRFRLGIFPESADFIPNSSWRIFEDEGQSKWMWQLKALPVSILNIGFIFLLWILLTPVLGMLTNISFPLPFLGFLICFIGVLILHELFHALLHPNIGSSRTIIGFWPARILLYASYDGEITRNRYLAVLLIPLFVLSIIPIFISALFQVLNIWVIYVTILNAFLSSGDVLATINILKLPANSIIMNHGCKAYWREKTSHDQPNQK
jgi:hypothetical protein